MYSSETSINFPEWAIQFIRMSGSQKERFSNIISGNSNRRTIIRTIFHHSSQVDSMVEVLGINLPYNG
jgi:hypothetical protein